MGNVRPVDFPRTGLVIKCCSAIVGACQSQNQELLWVFSIDARIQGPDPSSATFSDTLGMSWIENIIYKKTRTGTHMANAMLSPKSLNKFAIPKSF